MKLGKNTQIGVKELVFLWSVIIGIVLILYTVFLFGGLYSGCLCEKINLATFLEENLDRGCVEYNKRPIYDFSGGDNESYIRFEINNFGEVENVDY